MKTMIRATSSFFFYSTSLILFGATMTQAKSISFTPQLAPPSLTGPKLVKYSFAKDLETNFAPKEPMTEPKFRVDDKKICLSLTFKDFITKDQLEATAYLGPDALGKLSLPPITTPIPINQNINVGFCFPQEIYLVSNLYKIEVTLNGKWLGEFPFEIRPVNENSELVEIVTFHKIPTGEHITSNKFSPQEEFIYVRSRLKNYKNISSGKFVWTFLQGSNLKPNQLIKEIPFPNNLTEESIYAHINLPKDRKLLKEWYIGDYKVDVYLNDKLEGTFPFSVTDSPQK